MKNRSLWITGIAALVLFLLLGVIDEDIKETGGPGIVSFEVEFTSENARETLEQWGEEGRDSAVLSLWLDYALPRRLRRVLQPRGASRSPRRSAGGAGRSSRRSRSPPRSATRSRTPCLLMTIGQDGDQPWPLIAGVFASIKFLLLTPAQLFVLVGFVVWVSRRVRRR